MVAGSDATVVAEYARTKGGHAMNAKKVVQMMPKSKGGEKRSYTHNKYCYNTVSDASGTIYLCVTAEHFSRVTAFNFLEAAKKNCSQIRSNPGMLFQQLKKDVEFYSDPKNDKIQKIKSEIGQVTQIMSENIDKMLERGDKIDNLVEKTENLEAQSHEFKSGATTLKRKMWWKRFMMTCAIILVVLLAIFIVLLIACSKGGMNFKKCGQKDSHDDHSDSKKTPDSAPSTNLTDAVIAAALKLQ